MRKDFLPFSKPSVSEDAIADVCDSIRSGWLAMGPKTVDFEKKFAECVDAKHAVAVNSATAGLHLAVMAVAKSGDEVITTPMTFASTVNAIIYSGAVPVLVDIDPVTFNIDPKKIEEKITAKTKAIIPVHFAGRPCDMDAIEAIAQKYDLAIIEDSAHALGASYHGKKIGSCKAARHIAVFSFHPTKNITTGEGGMITTNDEKAADQMSVQRQNGMDKGAWNRFGAKGKSHYDIFIPGLKYQMMDMQAAIGRDQLKYLSEFNSRRTQIVARYNKELAGLNGVVLPAAVEDNTVHSWHIYTILLDEDKLGFSRDEFMEKMKEYNIGTAYHYQALHLFTAYGEITGLKKGDLPIAEKVGEQIVSLPLFPAMTDADVEDVVAAVKSICK
ncbi:DegT/DnrJ/EryC1/StrS family aminotransferase [Pectinatus brassicae]|uniref:dTDP-4-amino-4,6-dideoxygalactose transaminase n=1 Tax=Pectinatus brassicae TaxID=862415 RepID=A0A840UDL2_9FIRM|nr:DegT/DnrJ/EryC1/StrS family aminotransferase [Pectinatus brassicae]MBB5335099.1 dTDP-4-amino-4,6-dideoxygalactose transaminase [Pectinatus brassicae]